MIDRAESERLMLAREAGYIEEIEQVKGVSPEVLVTMAALYRAGWRDCWTAEAVHAWEEELSSLTKTPTE